MNPKKAQIALEQSEEVTRVLQAARRNASGDLEAMETALKAAVLAAGARLLEEFMNTLGVGRRAEAVSCPCGGTMTSRGIRHKEVLTLLGPVQFRRSLFQCPKCRRTRYPGDETLDLVRTSRSPGICRQVARLGAKEPFHEVARDLKELAGVELSRKDAERIAEGAGEDMARWDKAGREKLRTLEVPLDTPKTIKTLYIEFDGTGVPMTKKETEGCKGKQEDGTAKTREAKLGCVFTQTKLDEEGRPVRDPASTTFTGAIEKIIEEATGFLPRDSKAGKDARREIAYFQTNMERMRYEKFRGEGYFVGSGVIEAGCKTVIGKRLKQSGMEWTVRDANAIIVLRCTTKSGRLEDYWEQRAV